MNTISLEINNSRKMKLIQRAHDGLTLICIENGNGESEANIPDNEAFISAGDMVMLINYFRACKRGEIESDFIR